MSSITDERGYNQMFVTTPAQERRLQRRAEAIHLALGSITNGTDAHLLELGCGTGELARIIAGMTGAHVTGVDLSPKFIEVARARHTAPNLDFLVTDLTTTDYGDDALRCHAIFGNGILHHLYFHLDKVLPVLRRRLRPGGRFVFWEPNLWNPYIWAIFSRPALRPRARLEPEEMAFTARWISQKLAAAGFEHIDVSTRDFLLPSAPSFLISTSIALGNVAERIPGVRRLAQSLFITATNPSDR